MAISRAAADHRIEVGVARAAVDRVEFGAGHLEGDAQLDQRLDAAQARLHGLGAGWRGDRVGAAQLDVGGAPAQRAPEIDDAARRKHAAQRALGFLLDFFPAGFGDRRAIAEKMVLHLTSCAFAGRRLPMPRLPSEPPLPALLAAAVRSWPSRSR